jgi:CBS domain-containing protein
MQVGEACNREVIVVGRDEPVIGAVRLMRAHHVGDVVVVNNQGGESLPMGILTDRDVVLELVAANVDIESVTVGDAMSYELVTAAEDEELSAVIERMRDRGIRRLPVVNAAGGLVGILTVDDIMDLLAEQLHALTALVTKEQHHERERRTRP